MNSKTFNEGSQYKNTIVKQLRDGMFTISINEGLKIEDAFQFVHDLSPEVIYEESDATGTVSRWMLRESLVLDNSLGYNVILTAGNKTTFLRPFGMSGGSGGGVATNLALGLNTNTSQIILNSNGSGVTLPTASPTTAGLLSGSDKTSLNALAGAVTSIGAVSSTAVTNGATITAGVLNLAFSNSAFAGLISTAAQLIAGQKSFTSSATFFGVGTSNNALPYVAIGDLATAGTVYVDSRSNSLANINLVLRPKGTTGEVRAGTNVSGTSANLVLVQQSSVNFNTALVEVNALVVGATPIYTVTTGRKLLINHIMIRVAGTPVGVNTIPASISIGTNSTAFNNFMPDTVFNGQALLFDGIIRFVPTGIGAVFPSGSVINVRVNTAATGNTSLNYSFEMSSTER